MIKSHVAIILLAFLAMYSVAKLPAQNISRPQVLQATTCTPLGNAKDFNLYMTTDISQTGSDTEGRVAAGRNITFDGYSVGYKLTKSNGSRDDLIAGNNISFKNGQMESGNAAYANTGSFTSVSFLSGTSRKATPLNFSTTNSYLTSLSAFWGTLTTTGTTSTSYGSVSFTGSNTGTNIFRVSASALASANSVTVNTPSGSTAIINVTGTSGSLSNFGFTNNNINRSRVMYNFYQANTLTMSGITIEGSLLAPNATITFNNGSINGQLIGANLNGRGQINYVLFTGCAQVPSTSSPIPSPSPSRSPSPSPTPTPVPYLSCLPDCTSKTAGYFDAFNNFSETNIEFNQNEELWIKLSVNGAQNYSGTKPSWGITQSALTIQENINAASFEIVQPRINDTFRVHKLSGTTLTDSTTALCPDISPLNGTPDCITAIQTSSSKITGLTLNLPAVSQNEKYILYFKVIPTTPQMQSVQATSGYVRYKDFDNISYFTIPLSNVSIDIKGLSPFFTLSAGDIYSASNINPTISSKVPQNQTLCSGSCITYIPTNIDTGKGKISDSIWSVSGYTTSGGGSYNSYYVTYKNSIQTINATSLSNIATSGYYIDQNSIASGSLTIGSGWNTAVTNKKIVVFVPGNLFIDSGATLSVAQDGQSLITFIVQGNVGIHPSITTLDGMIISDGVIDTSCDKSQGFLSNNKCSPNNNDTNASLSLHGSFYAGQGFELNRKGTPGSIAGEQFIYRPDFLLSAADVIGQIGFAWRENKE